MCYFFIEPNNMFRYSLLFLIIGMYAMDYTKKMPKKSYSFIKKNSCDSDQKSLNDYGPPKGYDPIEEIERIICPALELMSKGGTGSAKRTVYFSPKNIID